MMFKLHPTLNLSHQSWFVLFIKIGLSRYFRGLLLYSNELRTFFQRFDKPLHSTVDSIPIQSTHGLN